MSTVGSYPVGAFAETKYFLVYDPSSQTLVRVLGSDLVNYITPDTGYVHTATTRATAQTQDYDIGTFIQVSGSTAIGDGGSSMLLVVAAGEGDFVMNNGNELLVLPRGSLSGSDLDGALVTDNGVQRQIQTALSYRPVMAASFAALMLLDLSGYTDVFTASFRAGEGKGNAQYIKDGVVTGTPSTAYADNSGFYDVNGDGYKLAISQKTFAETFGASGDGTDDQAYINYATSWRNSNGGGRTYLMPGATYGVTQYINVYQNCGLVGDSETMPHDPTGDYPTIKLLASATGKTLGTGSPIAAVVVEDAKSSELANFHVDGSVAPSNSYGIISAGMWMSNWRNIFVSGLDESGQTGIHCCVKAIGWFWNSFDHVWVEVAVSSQAAPIVITNAATFGGAATGNPNQTTFTNCRMGRGDIGWNLINPGAGMLFVNCQAEAGNEFQDPPTNSIYGIAVKVTGANPIAKPIWIGGEVNGYGSGFDGEIEVINAPVFAAPITTNGTRYLNGAVGSGYNTSNIFRHVFRKENNSQVAKHEIGNYGEAITVADSTATTIYTIDTATTVQTDSWTVEVTWQMPSNAARWGRSQMRLNARGVVTYDLKTADFTDEYGTTITPVFSMSGADLQITHTGGADVDFFVFVSGISRR